jgi:aspartyl-tRNA(Asn)/glutamyl-tRNA(Gln) amidotransferase subunit B
MSWDVVIGIETHVQLQTKTKIFSGASTAFGAEPNTQACVLSIALPGTLPVLNHEAVQCAIKFGLATNAEIVSRSIFARKNYFYPDLPKGYQISQYELPVVGKGSLEIEVGETKKTVRITRAHLEEDAGKSSHGAVENGTGIDLNRAGTPLLEIVSEPDMTSAAEAVAYAKKLHELVQWIGICDGNMQEGSFRCDINVSVKRKGTDKLGTRREIKNLNSFKFIEQAIHYETQWQIEMLEEGKTIQQATVLFNPETGETKAMRSKEEANDYRYFPDPDLLPLEISDEKISQIKADMTELPHLMKARLESDYQLSSYDAAGITSDKHVADYFFATLKVGAEPKQIANWILGQLFFKLNEHNLSIEYSPIKPEVLSLLLKRIQDGTISNNGAKQLFEKLWMSPDLQIDVLIESEGLKQVSDSGLIEAMIDEVLKNNQAMVDEYRSGKEKAFNALVGQIMKASKGKANPGQVNDLLKKKLS